MRPIPSRLNFHAPAGSATVAGFVQARVCPLPGNHPPTTVLPRQGPSDRAASTRLRAIMSAFEPEPSPISAQELKDMLNQHRLLLPRAATDARDTQELAMQRRTIADAVLTLSDGESVWPRIEEACKHGDPQQFDALVTLVRQGVIDPNADIDEEFDPLRTALLDATDQPPKGAGPSTASASGAASRLSVHERIGRLIDAGLNIEERTDYYMQTLLHVAAEKQSRPEVLRALLGHGIFVSSMNDFNQTPLHAALWEKGSAETVSILLASDARTDVRDRLDRSALTIAALAADEPAIIQAVIDKVKEHGEDIDAADADGNSALHYATGTRVRSRDEAIAVLIRNGANPLAENKDGDTPRYLYSQSTGKKWDF